MSLFSPWLLAPIAAAVSGWVAGYLFQGKLGLANLARSDWMKTLYVALLNKLYFDEVYDAYVVRPFLGIVNWLWRIVDLRGVNYAVQGIGFLALWVARGVASTLEARAIEGGSSGMGKGTLVLSRWLWGTIEARGVERLVQGSATSSVRLSSWLWRVVDRRATDQAIQGVGRLTDETGLALQKIAPRTLQHHLLLVVCWADTGYRTSRIGSVLL